MTQVLVPANGTRSVNFVFAMPRTMTQSSHSTMTRVRYETYKRSVHWIPEKAMVSADRSAS
jgi:hypothetical protein